MFYLSCVCLPPDPLWSDTEAFKVLQPSLEAFARLLETIFLIILFLAVFLCFLSCSVHMPFRLIWITLSFNSVYLDGSLVLAISNSDSFYVYFFGLCSSSGLFYWKAKQETWSGWFPLLVCEQILTFIILLVLLGKRSRLGPSPGLGLLDMTCFEHKIGWSREQSPLGQDGMMR